MPNPYSDNPGNDEPMAPVEPETSVPGTKPEDKDGETALIPKSLLGGKDFKPGEEVVLQIVRMYEDEAEVRYAPEKKDEGEDYGSPEMNKAQDELTSMAE